MSRTLGIVLLAVGILLVAFGLNSTESVADTVSEGVTGRYTDTTMWYLIGGGAMIVAGGYVALVRGRKSA